jgi:hypothetical protein
VTDTTDTNDTAVKPDALAALHGSAEALHANLVSALTDAGHVLPGRPPKPYDTVAIALDAGTASPGTPPNYADHALAAYQTGLAAAMMAFARAHLPERFQPAAELAARAVDEALDTDPTNDAQAYKDGVQAVVAAGEALLHKADAGNAGKSDA